MELNSSILLTITGLIIIIFVLLLIQIIREFRNDNFNFEPSIKKNSTIKFNDSSLNVLRKIYYEKLYLDPLLSLNSVSFKLNLPSELLAKLFRDEIPFTFSAYINYLRIMDYENNSNTKFDKNSSLKEFGFNSRSTYYYWHKRMDRISNQISPAIDLFIEQHPKNTIKDSRRETAEFSIINQPIPQSKYNKIMHGLTWDDYKFKSSKKHKN